MKSHFKLLIALVAFAQLSLASFSQTQTGIVKTKGRLAPNGSVIPGTRLAGVSVQIQGRNAVLSNNNGVFTFPVPGKSFYIQSVTKAGYELADPDIISRQHFFSAQTPLIIVMDTPADRLQDKLQAERSIRRNMQKRLQNREDEIERLKSENQITESKYQELLRQLYSDQERGERLISDMANRYSTIDYDQIDETNHFVNDLILKGELLKADSIINAKGDIFARIEQHKKHSQANMQEQANIAKRQKNLDDSKLLERRNLDDLGQDLYHKHEIHALSFQNDSAAMYLKLRADLDTTNVEWQLKAANFLTNYMSQYDSALKLYERILSVANISDKPSQGIARVYSNIGCVLEMKGKYAEALKYHNRALDMDTTLFGYNHSDVATCLDNIGEVYRWTSKLDLAEEYCKKAMLMREQIFGNKHEDTAESYKNMGSIYVKKKDYNKSIEYLLRAKNVYMELFGPKNINVASCNTHLGASYVYTKDLDRAFECLNSALEVYKEVHGNKHPTVASVYSTLAGACYLNKDYDKAIEYAAEALNIDLQVVGENHIVCAQCHNTLGISYRNKGDYDKALEHMHKALNIKKSVLGEKHPEVKTTYQRIASIYEKMGDEAKASEYNSLANQ